MPKNLRWKWIVIAVAVLGCLFGIIGTPKSTAELTANLKKNIRLGLDLKGGSHIVLQIQVQDAFRAEADLVIERLKELLKAENIEYHSIDRNEPASIETAETIQINIKGVPAAKTNDFRRLINDALSQQWVLSSESETEYRLNIRSEAALKLRQDTVTQSITTMEKKVNGLGVAEASVQQRGGSGGEAEILVQLPGVDDPARVKGILQTAAMLELRSERRTVPIARRRAEQQRGLTFRHENRARLAKVGRRKRGDWWLLARSPVVTGRDLRDAGPSKARSQPVGNQLHTHAGRGRAL